MDTPNIVIQPGTVTKIEPGATYAIAIREFLPKEAIEILLAKFKEETGATLILMVGVA